MRTLVAFAGVGALLLVWGCGRSEQAGGPSQPQDLSQAAVPESVTTPPPSAADVSPAGVPSTEVSAAVDPPADDPAADVAPDMTLPGASAGDPGPPQYPFESLVTATGDGRLVDAYKSCEDSLRGSPEDTDMQVQKVFLLYTAGRILMSQDAEQQALGAFRAASEYAQQVVKGLADRPEEYRPLLSGVFYNGACVESLDGRAEQAQAVLAMAVDWGWTDMEAISSDEDLENVRALPGFEAQWNQWNDAVREALRQTAREELAAGETFPFDFSVTDLDGTEIKLADLKGKVVIVDFWGTWCPPCRAEIPLFIKLQERYGPQGLQIIGLSYENGDDEAENARLVREFIDSSGINYPCALGTEEFTDQVPEFNAFPTTLFIDRTGKVRAKMVGYHPYDLLEALATTLLEESGDTGDTP